MTNTERETIRQHLSRLWSASDIRFHDDGAVTGVCPSTGPEPAFLGYAFGLLREAQQRAEI